MRNDNLKPQNTRTKEEQRKIAQKGAQASIIKRRRNKSMREVFRQIKNLPVNDSKLKQQLEAVGVDDKDITYAAAMAWSTMYHAMKGSSQMMRLAMEMMGEDASIAIREKELKLKERTMGTSGQGEATIIVMPPKDGEENIGK